VEFARLTPEQRQSFDEDGFLVVPNALSVETSISSLRHRTGLSEAFSKKPELIGRPEYNHLDLRPGLLREAALFGSRHQLAGRSAGCSIARPKYSSPFDGADYKRPEHPGDPDFRRGWHRDIRIPKDIGHDGCRV